MDHILWVTGLVLLIGASILIIARAYHFDPVWGLATLLFPVAAPLAFIFRHWEASNPRVNIVFVSAIILLLFSYTSFFDRYNHRNQMQAPVLSSTPVPEPVADSSSALAKAERTRELIKLKQWTPGSEDLANDMDEPEPSVMEPMTAAKVENAPQLKKVSPKLAGQFIGYPATITLNDNIVRHGIIRKVQLGSITVGRVMHKGEFTYDVAIADIKSMEVSR